MIKISDTEYFSNDKTIRFLNMDCNEFMKGLKENEFDLAVSDPPYNIVSQQKRGVGSRIDKSGKMNNWNNETPSQEHFKELFRTTKGQIIWGANNYILPVTEYFCIWNKHQTVDNFASAEYAWVSPSLKTPAKVFDMPIHKHNASKGEKIHPTMKPIDLYRWIIHNYTKPTDTILDCFGGSMSHAIAAHMERRKLTIIELDKDYFDAALKRFDFYERQMKLF